MNIYFLLCFLGLVPSLICGELYCRNERNELLTEDQFKQSACAWCYIYLPKDKFFPNKKLSLYRNSVTKMFYLLDRYSNRTLVPDPTNTSSPVFHTFASFKDAQKWTLCCQSAATCCRVMQQTPQPETPDNFCPQTWDGWQCWGYTPAGETREEVCQDHVYLQGDPPSCERYTSKSCLSDGTWFKKGGKEWTDYTSCGKLFIMQRRLYFNITTHAISVCFLIPALIIFTVYKQLRVHRIAMHRNFFASLLLYGVFSILYKAIVMLEENNPDSILERNEVGCKILFAFTKYFRMTNYMWMFCEGFYLHKLIAAAFAEQKSLLIFYIMGWGFPIIPVVIYAAFRAIFADEKCWAKVAEPYEWVINGPNLLSLFLNLLFLCNIIRVLLTKLRGTHSNEPSQYRKAVRATLVLIPLFGLHFLVVMYRPSDGDCILTEGYHYFGYIMDGLQGCMVSLIFCFMNSEVLYLLKRTYQRYRLQKTVGGQGSVSFPLTRMSMSTQVSTLNCENNHSKKCVPLMSAVEQFDSEKAENV